MYIRHTYIENVKKCNFTLVWKPDIIHINFIDIWPWHIFPRGCVINIQTLRFVGTNCQKTKHSGDLKFANDSWAEQFLDRIDPAAFQCSTVIQIVNNILWIFKNIFPKWHLNCLSLILPILKRQMCLWKQFYLGWICLIISW